MSGPQPVCNCQCEEKSSPFSRGRVRQCGVRQREQSPPTMHVSCVHSVSRQISAVYCEADQPPPPTTWVHLHATHFQNLAFSLFLQNNMSAFSALEDMYVQCSLLSIQQTQIFLAYFPWEWGKICMHKYLGEAQLVILSVTWESSVIYEHLLLFNVWILDIKR